MTLALTLVFCCAAPLALAAGAPGPADPPRPSLLQSQPLFALLVSAKAPQGTSSLDRPQPKWMDVDPECDAACFDQFTQCCTYGGCEQCSCQLALCRSSCGVPWYGC
jgi:hypothetical protein